jgi:hypothetical protein
LVATDPEGLDAPHPDITPPPARRPPPPELGRATNVSVRKGHRPTATVKPSVTGNVTLTVTGPKGYKASRTVRVVGGHSFTYSVSKSVSAKGTYTVKVSLNPTSNSYANSSTSKSVTVK